MATEFKIPNLGDGITGGDVLNVLVKVGDTVAKDQGVLELETDKATIEVPSSVAGTVSEIKVKSGDKVTIGQVVLTLNEGASSAAADAPSPSPEKASPAPPPPQASAPSPSQPANQAPPAPAAPAAPAASSGEAVTFNIPNLGDGIKGGDVLNVLVKVGDTVAKDQGVLELETDKATIEVPSSVAGTVTEIKVKAGDKVTIGQGVIVLTPRRRPRRHRRRPAPSRPRPPRASAARPATPSRRAADRVSSSTSRAARGLRPPPRRRPLRPPPTRVPSRLRRRRSAASRGSSGSTSMP